MSALAADASGVLVACPSCGRRNRLRFSALGQHTRCGACQTPLSPPAEPVELSTTAVFDAAIGQSALPVLVDFWAAWCGPCRVVAPHVAEVARRLTGQVLVAKLDTDAVPDVAARFSIRSIPTLAVFRDGREVDRMAGATGSDALERFARRALT